MPIAGSSYKWQRTYNGRTAVERVNSRIDLSFGLEEYPNAWYDGTEGFGGSYR